MNIYEKLMKVQSNLHAPKNQRNNFGNYDYRSAEDILEAVKPLLTEYGLAIVIEDEIKEIGSRIYVSATVRVINIEKTEETIITKAYAREAEQKKGMDLSQVTGATSSYARKYALNGMFAIDDNKDADTNEYNTEVKKPSKDETKKQELREQINNFVKAKGIDPNIVTQNIQNMFQKSNSQQLDEVQLKALLIALRDMYKSK